MSVAIQDQANEEKSSATRWATTSLAAGLEAVGMHCIRYGLVLVLLWIGAMKFTAYEAEGISGFVANSPFMSWAYGVLSQRQLSSVIGVIEVLVGLSIAARPLAATISAVGSLLAAGMFLTTLSFLLTTPGVIEPSIGFPGLSVVPGQFLLKDIVLLGASVLTAGEAMRLRHLSG